MMVMLEISASLSVLYYAWVMMPATPKNITTPNKGMKMARRLNDVVKHPQTGTAVSYLIRSIAKLAETSDSGTALISFLYTRS